VFSFSEIFLVFFIVLSLTIASRPSFAVGVDLRATSYPFGYQTDKNKPTRWDNSLQKYWLWFGNALLGYCVINNDGLLILQ